MNPKRVIVCGGREYDDAILVLRAMLALPDGAVIVQGGATGADAIARNVAKSRGFAVETFPADWDRYGLRAGPMRNQQMLNAGADLVVAFTGGRGTADMVRRARRAGVPVWEVADDEWRPPSTGK